MTQPLGSIVFGEGANIMMWRGLAVVAMAVCCLTVTAQEAKNLVVNGALAKDISGWTGRKLPAETNKPTAAPEYIAHVADDGANETKGCIKISVSLEGVAKNARSWTTGVFTQMTEKLKGLGTYKITFWAKSIDGSSSIMIGRPSGGGHLAKPVAITDKWAKYEATLTLMKWDTKLLMFAPVDSKRVNVVEAGTFLLDEVSVEEVKPAAKPPVATPATMPAKKE
jgi:hypothetical protein